MGLMKSICVVREFSRDRVFCMCSQVGAWEQKTIRKAAMKPKGTLREIMMKFVLVLLVLFASSFVQAEKWSNARDLSVSAAVCESQSIYLLKQMGVAHIAVGSMITQGDYQNNKVFVFCEPKAEASRFLVAVEGNDEYAIGQLGKMILNNQLIGSTRFTDNKNAEDETIKRNLISDEDVLQMALDKGKGKFFVIYSKYLRINPALRGRIDFSFTTAQSGDVVDVKINSSELNSKEFENEIIAYLKSMKFPPIKRSTSISHSMTFIPMS